MKTANPARESDFTFLRYAIISVAAQISALVGVLWLA